MQNYLANGLRELFSGELALLLYGGQYVNLLRKKLKKESTDTSHLMVVVMQYTELAKEKLKSEKPEKENGRSLVSLGGEKTTSFIKDDYLQLYTMVNTSIIRVKKVTKKQLDRLKQHPRETYGDIIDKLVVLQNHKNKKK